MTRSDDQLGRRAALEFGLAEVAFLRYPDGDVENTQTLRSGLVAWSRQRRLQALFTHELEHPLPPYLSHHDHRIDGRATLGAVYPSVRDHLDQRAHLNKELRFPAYG